MQQGVYFMGLIFGVVSRNGDEVSTAANRMMRNIDHSNSDSSWLISNGAPATGNVTLKRVCDQALGQASFATEGFPEAPAFDRGHGLAVLFEGNLYNIQELKGSLKTGRKSHLKNASEIVARLLADNYHGDLKTTVKQIAPVLDGAYLLAASDGRQTVVLRDMTGLRPAFYAQNGRLIAFASLKRLLWDIGLRNVKPLRAGTLACFSKKGVILEDVCSTLVWGGENQIEDMATSVDYYCDFVREAVSKRIRGLKKVGVLMSGGVDSCLMAKLVKDMAVEREIEVTAYTAGVDGTSDIEYARQFARELGLRHRVFSMSQDIIESCIPQVALAVEERDMVQIEAGIGIYAALKVASQDETYQVFSGQGPDELWGGYTWYPNIIAAEGHEGLRKRMQDDWQRGDIETFDRENKIALAHRSEQLFPYCDAKIVGLAANVSPRLKVKSADDRIGKHTHREAAVRLGVPEEVAYRTKNAAQHGTGVHDTLSTISRKNGFTPELVSSVGYSNEKVSGEKLASSSRYGYRYADKHLWQVPDHIQFFFDSIAYRKGLLNEAERSAIGQFLQKAGMQ